MSFEALTPQFQPPRRHLEGISASLVQLKSAPAKLWLTFKPAALLELHWRYDMRFAVLMGAGEDFGRVRLRPDDHGTAKLERRQIRWDADFGRINLGIVKALPDEKRGTTECKVLRLPDRWVEIELPAWAQRRRAGRPRLVSHNLALPKPEVANG